MKFLLDQDVYAETLRFLQNLGHDTIPVAQIGLAQAADCLSHVSPRPTRKRSVAARSIS